MARLSPNKVRPKLRAWAKYALQVQHEKQYTEIALAALIARRVVRRPRTKLILLVLAAVCVERVQQIDRACRGVPHPIEVRIINFLTADESTFPLHCRFRLPNMRRLARALRIPEWFKLSNESYVQGEHALIVFLRLFSTYHRLVDMEIEMGFELTKLCRIRTAVLDHLYDLHHHRVTDYFDFFTGRLDMYKRAIQRRKLRKSPDGTYPSRTADVCCYLDGHRYRICQPSSTPANVVPAVGGGEPIPFELERDLYNGHKCMHNLLFIICTGPDGLIMFIGGPYLGKGNDLNALADSDIIAKFRQAIGDANMDVDDFSMLGDKIFPDVPGLHAMYSEPMNDQARLDNIQDADGRASVEHANGRMLTQWNSMAFSTHQQVQKSDLAKRFIVASVLTNAYSLLEGNQTLAQFTDPNNANELAMPTLDHYFDV